MFVGEPSVEDTIAILRGLKERYETHHGVRIKDAAILAAATLSHRYITDRFLPDKAIDLIDESGASLRMQLDWIQYKQNFREVVSVAQGSNQRGDALPIMDVHIDTRQVVPGCLRDGILRAMARANPETSPETSTSPES